jgi:hypothetical protein
MKVPYGVMGILERIREPRAEGVAPSLLGVAPGGPPAPEAPGCGAGVSRTSLRNWELFMAGVVGWWRFGTHGQFLG